MRIRFVQANDQELIGSETGVALRRVREVPSSLTGGMTHDDDRTARLWELLKQSIDHHCPEIDLDDPYSVSKIASKLGVRIRFVSAERLKREQRLEAERRGVDQESLQLVTCEVESRSKISMVLVDSVDTSIPLQAMGHEVVHILLHGCIDPDRRGDADAFDPTRLGDFPIFAIEPINLTRSGSGQVQLHESQADIEATQLAKLLLLPERMIESAKENRSDPESQLAFLKYRSALSKSQILKDNRVVAALPNLHPVSQSW